MNTLLGCLTAGFLAAGGLFATPDHAVDVKEQFFGSNAIYLQLSCGQDEGRETRLLCLPPGRSKQVNDQLAMQPIYLVAGTFDTEEAAVASARELLKKAAETKFYNIHPEVWSARPPTDKVVWHVVERFSTEMIASNAVARTEAALGIRLVPMTSKSFIERTVIDR